MSKIAVYSCITGIIDTHKNEQNWGDADWFMFTDQEGVGGRWQKRNVPKMFVNPRRNSRWLKTTPHILFPDYDYTIWIDGSMQLNLNPGMLIAKYMNDSFDLGALDHPDRSCVYEEAEACKRLKLDDPAVIDKQMRNYKESGYVANGGLYETKIVIRKNTNRVKNFNNLWTTEILNNSVRDQLSFGYSAWMNVLAVKKLPTWKTTQDFKYYHHDIIK
jgi:hypothetical protein